MKQIIAIIRPQLYYETKEVLREERFFSMSVKEVYGRGRYPVQFSSQIDDKDVSGENVDSLILKKRIDIYVNDDEVERLIETILKVNSGQNAGDGKIFIIPVKECTRIHTGEKNENALV